MFYNDLILIAFRSSISLERYRCEVRRALNDEELCTIAYNMSGPDAYCEWVLEGKRVIPLLCRSEPQTCFTPLADTEADSQTKKNHSLPEPSETRSLKLKIAAEDFKSSKRHKALRPGDLNESLCITAVVQSPRSETNDTKSTHSLNSTSLDDKSPPIAIFSATVQKSNIITKPPKVLTNSVSNQTKNSNEQNSLSNEQIDVQSNSFHLPKPSTSQTCQQQHNNIKIVRQKLIIESSKSQDSNSIPVVTTSNKAVANHSSQKTAPTITSKPLLSLPSSSSLSKVILVSSNSLATVQNSTGTNKSTSATPNSRNTIQIQIQKSSSAIGSSSTSHPIITTVNKIACSSSDTGVSNKQQFFVVPYNKTDAIQTPTSTNNKTSEQCSFVPLETNTLGKSTLLVKSTSSSPPIKNRKVFYQTAANAAMSPNQKPANYLIMKPKFTYSSTNAGVSGTAPKALTNRQQVIGSIQPAASLVKSLNLDAETTATTTQVSDTIAMGGTVITSTSKIDLDPEALSSANIVSIGQSVVSSNSCISTRPVLTRVISSVTAVTSASSLPTTQLSPIPMYNSSPHKSPYPQIAPTTLSFVRGSNPLLNVKTSNQFSPAARIMPITVAISSNAFTLSTPTTKPYNQTVGTSIATKSKPPSSIKGVKSTIAMPNNWHLSSSSSQISTSTVARFTSTSTPIIVTTNIQPLLEHPVPPPPPPPLPSSMIMANCGRITPNSAASSSESSLDSVVLNTENSLPSSSMHPPPTPSLPINPS